MPLELLSVSIVKRSAGRSAVQPAAYQSGEKLHDARRDTTYYPPKKRDEDLRYTELMLPKGSPDWGREEFWNEVEARELRKDSQLARAFIGSLPRPLPPEWRRELAREFAQTLTEQGMAVDLAIHEGKAADELPNHHVHYLVTMRPLDEEGFGKKNTAWNRREQLAHWRSEWGRITNEYLEDYGLDDRIDMRSYEARGLDRIPQRHLGHKAHQMEKRGVETQTGNYNRHVRHLNLAKSIDYETTPEEVIQQEQWEHEHEHNRPLERAKGRGR